jgi:hypothetical protein
MNSWQEFLAAADQVPPAVWILTAVAAVAGTWKATGRRMRRAGQRVADPHLVAGRAKTKDTALTLAAMVPAVAFWVVVLAGSFRGLVAFGRDTLGWRDGWEYLVPGSLDGVAVTFAFLAFRAIRKQKAPDRCYRVVWGAAIASALVNFNYEYEASGHNLIAGGYLALLSLFGMVMFHEFLHQFEEGTAYIRRDNPKFGLRWLTWPTNTFCAAVAWHNHPPARGAAATVRNAVANLERVRAIKRAARDDAVHARHERALARARRRTDLSTARTGPPPTGTGNAPDAAAANGHQPAAAASHPPATPPAPHTAPPLPLARSGGSKPATGVKVPGTAWRTRRWIDTWVQMCADGDLVFGPINDDQHARATYGASSRHLDNIRRAATSGALRDRARELSVPLPAAYVDDPARSRLNGKARASA